DGRDTGGLGAEPDTGRVVGRVGLPSPGLPLSDHGHGGERAVGGGLGDPDDSARRSGGGGEPLRGSEGEPGDPGEGGGHSVPPRSPLGVSYLPTPEAVPPAGAKARFRANVDAIRMRHELAESGRQPSEEDLTVLARWSSWGALSEVFDESKQEWATER